MADPQLSPAAQAALDLIRRHRTGTSFVEVVGAIDAAGVPTDGEAALCSSRDPNILYWVGVSSEVVDAVTELLRAKLVHLHPTEPLVYHIDGQVPMFPIAQRPPSAGYKEPHWLPAVLNAGPAPQQGI
ncbi:hypothetical protein [Micromonospora purpureochromogenes]|uniref:Immunity protein 35 n=1 Tax=Micromonospora purpureochromogenes TaxID=47872 RepID=A0ABX2RMV7_9ACTN|nr:hypothetical protein [Micromonospora purpureochromogenes]NYF57875.1 hypothetical protein [Micromonospora purpureochromogenes]